MQRVSAVLGSALFFVVAPCVLAGLIPWSMTRWEFRPAFFGLEGARSVGVLRSWLVCPDLCILCTICASRTWHPCARCANQELGGHRPLPACAQSDLRRRRRNHPWSGYVVWRLAPHRLRRAVMARLPRLRRGVRRTHARSRRLGQSTRHIARTSAAGFRGWSPGEHRSSVGDSPQRNEIGRLCSLRQISASLGSPRLENAQWKCAPWDPRRTISID